MLKRRFCSAEFKRSLRAKYSVSGIPTIDCTAPEDDDDDTTEAGDDDDSGDDDDDAGDDDSAGDDDDTTATDDSPAFPGATRLSDGEDGEGCRSDVGGRGPVGLWLVLLLAYGARSRCRSGSLPIR